MHPINKTSQEQFDEKYITGSEIQKLLGVDRSMILNARKRGMLPEGIRVGSTGAYIWERKPVEPFLDAWRISLSCHRGRKI